MSLGHFDTTWWQALDGRVEIEHEWEATAGYNLTTGTPWWGTRVKLRRAGSRRWHKLTIEGVHPFDYDAVKAGILAALDQGAVRL